MSQAEQKHDEQRAAGVTAGDRAVLARRYGGALFDLAAEQGHIDTVAKNLVALRDMQKNSPEFRMATTQPRLARAEMVKAMQALTASAKLNPLTGNFLSVLAQNQRLSILVPAVINAFLATMAAGAVNLPPMFAPRAR